MRADAGFPRADVENDFLRARRRQVLARLARRLRREPDDVNLILPPDEVVAALGMVGEQSLGLPIIRLDSVVGTVDSRRDFDRKFRPTSSRVRARWERLALAQRRGEPIPPIDVYRVGDLHFVQDGHHRVSIAMATGAKTIEAYVTQVRTAVPAHRFLDREQVAQRWFAEEYTPVVRMLRAADLIGSGTEAEAYQRVARERYRLIRMHEWSDEVIERLRNQVK
jgi:hypothetical protein